jgi:hypothetical protein
LIEVAILRWAVWTAASPLDVGFLPPLMRRRCSALTRAMLHVAFQTATPEELGTLPSVFASRHGEVRATLSLLDVLARRQPVTAAAFSHSVHNAQVGLFSIAANNRGITSAVAAGEDTFGAAFLEAVMTRHRAGRDTALLVVADEVLPDVFASFCDDPPVPYAVGMMLGSEGTRIGFTPGGPGSASDSRLPAALQFVQWLGSTEPELTLGGRTSYTWTRGERHVAPPGGHS